MASVTTPDGVRLAYDDLGPADGPLMVLLHALGQTCSTWAPVIDALAEHHRVLALDLRGHGDSDWPGQYGFQLMADDVRDALDALGLERATLIGHSMGGVVGYLLAVQHPHLVARLVVEDVPPPYERERALPVRDEEAAGFDWPVVPAIVSEVNAGAPTLWADLARVQAPTLLVGGGPSSSIPQELLVQVAERIPDCTLVTIDVGHHVHAEAPEEFARAVLGWAVS